MRISLCALGNLNKRHWDRRVWQVGYRGPLLPQQKATGRPDHPVRQPQVAVLRQRFIIEHNTMKMLTKPYLNKEVCEDYYASQGVANIDELRERTKQLEEMRKMPGKPKLTDACKSRVLAVANVGNNMHSHVTVEESLGELARRNRWD